MPADDWTRGLQRHVEAAVHDGQSLTSEDVVDLASELVAAGVLSHVNTEAPKGNKKAHLQNRAHKVYQRVVKGEDSDAEHDNENPPATTLNRKGRCGTCSHLDHAIKASILYGADKQIEGEDERAAADEAKKQIVALKKSLEGGASGTEHLGHGAPTVNGN